VVGQYSIFEHRVKNSCVWEKGKYPKVQAWLDLITMRVISDSRDYFNNLDRKRGHVYTSITSLSARWSWDRKTVRKFLDDLEAEGRITYLHLPQNKGIDIRIPYYVELNNEQVSPTDEY
jgi:hypothetical protein